jgi:cholesterol oxidase
MTEEARYDAVVIGSGFGGSVSAYELAKANWNVLLLERGRPWPPGSFPRTPRAAGQAFWDPPNSFGMFDVWSFSGINAITASGLGGGSLIYANVLLRKPESTFVYEDGTPWPVRRADLEQHYDAVQAVIDPVPYPPELADTTPKTIAMRNAAAALGKKWESSPLAVAFAAPGRPPVPGDPLPDDPDNLFGLPRCTCRLCGECDIGCNFGSKQTLDHTYLSLAKAEGAELRTLCQVHTIAPDDGGYAVTYRQPLAGREGVDEELLGPDLPEVTVRAKKVVVAAGTVGTARLLLRNRANLPALGGLLGQGFSSNGDLLTATWDSPEPLDMTTGPVITGTIRWDDDPDCGRRMLQVQDGGAPALAEWMFNTLDMPATMWASLSVWRKWLWSRLRGRRDTQMGAELASLIGKARLSAGTLPLLGMGRDVPGGRFYLAGDDLELTWNETASKRFFDDLKRASALVAEQLGGEYREIPVAHLITVHGLGGCAMGAFPYSGVVDEWGESFGHPGLVVADGSVLPGPVGPNPSLTIAALARRFATHMTEPQP